MPDGYGFFIFTLKSNFKNGKKVSNLSTEIQVAFF